MKHILISIYLSCFVLSAAFAQLNSLDWVRTMGSNDYDRGDVVATDAAGNVIVGGYFKGTFDVDPGVGVLNFTTAGGEDMFIVKLSPAGNLIWARQIGGVDDDNITWLTLDSDENIIVSGSFRSTCDFDPGNGVANLTAPNTAMNIFVLKLNSSGNYIWAHGFGDTGNDEGNFVSIDSNDNIFLVGSFEYTIDFDPGASIFNLTSVGQKDVFFCKFNSAGNFIEAGSMGGAFSEYPYSACVDDVGNLYISGTFESICDFDPGPGTANLSSSGDKDGFVMKIDSSGNYIWAKKIGGSQQDIIEKVITDNEGALYISGYFRTTVDLNPGSGSYPVTSAGDFDIFITKWDTSGAFVWGQRFGNLTSDVVYDIALAEGNTKLLSTGSFAMDVDFDGGPGDATLTSFGSSDIFILSTDTSGNYVWVKQFGGQFSEMGRSITTDFNNRIVTTGFSSGVCDYDPNAGIYNINTNGGDDIYIMKLGPSGVGLDDMQETPLVNIYPNPFNDFIILEWFAETTCDIIITLYDISGKKINADVSWSTNQYLLSTQFLPAGVYMVHIISEGKSVMRKLVKSQ